MGFDLLFMFQHYILYNPNKKKRELLLAGYTDDDKKPTHIVPIDSIIPINDKKWIYIYWSIYLAVKTKIKLKWIKK